MARRPATKGRRRAGAEPAPGWVRWAAVGSPIGRLHVAWTPRGVAMVSIAAHDGQGDTEAQQEGRFLSDVERWLGPGEQDRGPGASGIARAVTAWFETGEAPLVDLEPFSGFRRRVMELAMAIPRGQVRSYGELARAAGRPGAARAVGQVMARNPIPLFVPCHRVVRADGRLGEYSGGGAAIKRRLLAMEGWDGAGKGEGDGR